MYKPLVTGVTALALVLSFATNASANPKNKFGNYNTAKAKSTAIATADGGDANGNGGAAINLKNYRGEQRAVADGLGGYAGRGGTAKAYSESFNRDVEVISYQEMKATVWGAPIHVYGSVAYGGNADGGYGGDADADGHGGIAVGGKANGGYAGDGGDAYAVGVGGYAEDNDYAVALVAPLAGNSGEADGGDGIAIVPILTEADAEGGKATNSNDNNRATGKAVARANGGGARAGAKGGRANGGDGGSADGGRGGGAHANGLGGIARAGDANGGRGGNAHATGGVLRTGDVRQSVALTGSFGGMANLAANTGINSANLGGISVAAHVGSVNVGR